MSKKQRVKKLHVKKMNVGVYVAAFLVIASAMMMAIMISMAEFGFLNIRKVKLIVQTETLSKVYDGEPLVGENYEIIYGKLAAGHSIKILSTSKQTEIGECVNHLEFMIRDTSGSDVTKQYEIEQRAGTLKVAMRDVAVRLASTKKVYDGTPLSDSGWTVVSPSGFAEGHTAHVYAAPEITDVGVIPNNGTVKVLDKDGRDVTSQYSLTVEEGTLEVTARPITITTDSSSKIYDGLPLSDDGWYLSMGELSPEHQLTVHCTAQITEVGEIANKATVAVYDALGINMTDQYEITVDTGTLNVMAQTLYITTGSAEKLYDGTPISSNSWQITSGALNAGDTIEYAGGVELNDVGTISNTLTFVIRDPSGKDITERYEIHQVTGSLTVKPRKISVMTGSAQKKYDGQPLSTDRWTMISGSLCNDHSLTVVGTRRTNVGVSENVLVSYAVYQTRNGVKTDVTDCYQITFSYGTLTVDP